MSRVMISYRREDSAAFAGRLYDRLLEEFGRDGVFRDIDSISPGQDFAAALENVLGQCDVVVAVIGKDWLTVAHPAGGRRLDDPGDWVRLEIATALKRNIRVVPFLMPGARMPAEAELPADLKALARRNAIATDDVHFDADVERLVSTLPKGLSRWRVRRRIRGTVLAAAVLALLAWAGIYIILTANRGSDSLKLKSMTLTTRILRCRLR